MGIFSVHLYVGTSVSTSPLWAIQHGLRLQAWLAGLQARLDDPEGEQTDGLTDEQKISPFYRTFSPIREREREREREQKREMMLKL